MVFISKRVVFRPNFHFLVNINENWLHQMAEKGWLLVGLKGWLFEFECIKPANKKFFIYSGFDASKGISFDYHSAKVKYAKSSSILNKKDLCVFEVDLKKEDEEFLYYLRSRNRYYMRFYVKQFIFSLFLTLISVFAFSYEKTFFVLVAITLMLSIYSIMAVFILKKTLE